MVSWDGFTTRVYDENHGDLDDDSRLEFLEDSSSTCARDLQNVIKP